jgi:hypothetical protein
LVLFPNFDVAGAGNTYQYDNVTFAGGSLAATPKASVTFQVDMSGVETSADGVYLAGGGIGQDGLLMTDDGNDVWSVTAELDFNSQVLYKFRNQPSYGGWDGFEDEAGLVVGGCNTGEYNDRYIDVAEADIVLPVVAYGSCTAVPYVDPVDSSDTVSVSFQVDMTAVETVHPDGVYLAGGGVFGQDGLLMSDNGNGVWSVTTDLPINSQVLYKFRNQPSLNTWDGFEDQAGIIAGGCATGTYNDRFVDVAEADIVLSVVAYGSCSAEPFDPSPALVLSVGDSIDFETDIAIESFGDVVGEIVDGELVALKPENGQTWGGNVIGRGSIVFPLTSSDAKVTVDVHSTVPAIIRMKLESAVDGNQSAEVDSTTAHTGSGWETLTFDFTGTNAIDANFSTLVLFPNFDVLGAGNTYKYDNITFIGGASASGSWDFDQDGNADALTDGLLLLRYAFGLTGDALVASAISESSPLTPEQVQENVAASTTSFADIDDSGNVDALTDGLLLLRYLFGLTGDALIASAVAENANRASADDIEAYIVSLYP